MTWHFSRFSAEQAQLLFLHAFAIPLTIFAVTFGSSFEAAK
jgi:hypothetical protein